MVGSVRPEHFRSTMATDMHASMTAYTSNFYTFFKYPLFSHFFEHLSHRCDHASLYSYFKTIYFQAKVIFHGPGNILAEIVSAADIEQKMILCGKIIRSYSSLSWTAIYFVKFAFLAFFRNLVNRLPLMLMYWKIAVITTTFASILQNLHHLCPTRCQSL